MKTLIDITDGVSVELEMADTDRSWKADSEALAAKFGCQECKHHVNAHRTGSCTVLVVPADKRIENIANAKKCGCAAMKQ